MYLQRPFVHVSIYPVGLQRLGTKEQYSDREDACLVKGQERLWKYFAHVSSGS